MVYIFVLFGSLLGICLVLGVRMALQHRTVRRFVHSVMQRSTQYEKREAVEDAAQQKSVRRGRTSARELQQVKLLIREAERAIARDKLEEAERSLIQALTVIPGESEVQAQLAKLYLSTDRVQKAEALYKELVQKADIAPFHANLALAFFQQGKYSESCDSYKDALRCDPKNPERFAALGKACIAAQRYEEAALSLEKATERLSRDTDLLHLLADCYLHLNLPERAQETYIKINRLQPYDEEVKQKIAALAQV